MNVGSHIGQYRILRKIGVGGMGTVYLGEHILLGRRAAIKTLLPALSQQTEIVERFFTEARATSAITDHGVVQIFDFGYHVDGTAYIVMELLEGESLQTRIDRLGQIAPSDALRIGRQVAASLAAAHACEIVHRDLKPDNIYLIADAEAQSGERTKILDFGICKLGVADGEPSLTQSGMTMGTPVYMSPEQCRGAGLVDQRSDIYALGCVLFHMIAGRPPFECDGAGEFIVAHLQEEPPAPSSFIPELPDLVDGLILRCLEKSADDRFQSMTELQHALEYVLARISSSNIVVPPITPAMPMAPGFRKPSEPSVLVESGGSAKQPTTRRRKSNSSKSPAGRARSSSIGAASGQVMKSGGQWSEEPLVKRRSRAAVAIVVFGLAAALLATLVMTSGDDAVAGSSPAGDAAENYVTASPASTPEPAPPIAIVAPIPVPVPVPVPVAILAPTADAETATATTPAATKAVDEIKKQPTATKSAKARPQAKPQRPAPRPAITSPAPAKTEPAPPAEDLYDTR